MDTTVAAESVKLILPETSSTPKREYAAPSLRDAIVAAGRDLCARAQLGNAAGFRVTRIAASPTGYFRRIGYDNPPYYHGASDLPLAQYDVSIWHEGLQLAHRTVDESRNARRAAIKVDVMGADGQVSQWTCEDGMAEPDLKLHHNQLLGIWMYLHPHPYGHRRGAGLISQVDRGHTKPRCYRSREEAIATAEAYGLSVAEDGVVMV